MGVAGAITMGFVLDGVNDPQALPLVVALAAVVATLLVASVVGLQKGRTRSGVAGLVSVAAKELGYQDDQLRA